MHIEHLSISRRGVYHDCNAKYKFQYHLQLPRDLGIDEPIYFIYGKIIHTIAEEFVLRNGKSTLNAIAKEVLSGKLEVEEGVKAPKLPAEYQSKLPDHLRSLKKLNDKIGVDGTVEYEFLHDLEPPNKKFLKGFIDRIIVRNGKYFLIDYKTTKKGRFRKNRATITQDMQLKAYAAVVRRNFNVKAEDIRAALYYLDGGELFATTFTEASLDKAEAELLQTYNQIAAHDPNNIVPNVGEHCRRCDYRLSCPFVKLT